MSRKTKIGSLSLVVISLLILSACSPFSLAANAVKNAQGLLSDQNTETTTQVEPEQEPTASTESSNSSSSTTTTTTAPAVIGDWEAMQETLQQIYEKVNPSVVNIQVISTVSSSTTESPFGFFSYGDNQQSVPVQEGQGSGFVWDKEGHIVTNNHVVENATKVTVVFSDGWTVDAQVVGTDVNSDLAVIKVDVDQDRLYPVQLADSDQVKVGQLAIAIGNPFGLSGTQTVGFISALGRSLDVESSSSSTGTYSIPDVIQTDAPINPGNSGGVLVNDVGQVMGVTAAIQSSTDSSAGIGFVIPSAIVQKVVPGLIQNGKYDYPWIGISGLSLTQDIAVANNLDEEQRGAFVTTVTSGGPAEDAGLQGYTSTTTVDSDEIPVGGDVITKIDGNDVTEFDDIVSYLIRKTQPGQTITLTILRDGKEQEVDVTLGTRPTESSQNLQTYQDNSQDNGQGGNSDQGNNGFPGFTTPDNGGGDVQTPEQSTKTATLGITGLSLDADIAKAIDLNEDQTGVLVQEVVSGGAADQAGIQGGVEEETINGQTVLLGGDVIVAFDGTAITSFEDLKSAVTNHSAGDNIQLTVLRNGVERQIDVTLGGN